MNLLLIEDNELAKFINLDNVDFYNYDKMNKVLHIHFRSEQPLSFTDISAETIYNYLKTESTTL